MRDIISHGVPQVRQQNQQSPRRVRRPTFDDALTPSAPKNLERQNRQSPRRMLKSISDEELIVPAPKNLQTWPESQSRVNTSPRIPRDESQPQHGLKSSQPVPLNRTSPVLQLPSDSRPVIGVGYSKHQLQPTTSLALPQPPSPPSHLPPHPNHQVSHQHTATRAQSPRHAPMTPSASPSTDNSPRSMFDPMSNRRHDQTRNRRTGTNGPANHPNWRDYSVLNICVKNLPINVTTLQIWRNFKKHGELCRISIKRDSGNHSSRTATVCYKPPPEIPFWEKSGTVTYQHGNRTSRIVYVSFDNYQPKNQEIRSPVRPNVSYNEEHTLIGNRIDFGVLTSPSSFLSLKTREADNQLKVKFHVNLARKEIIVYFPSPIKSENSGLVIREYRFKVAFDQSFVLSQVEDDGENLVLFLEVNTPPPYSKKLEEAAAGSHIDEARRWSEEDLWARQTDIADTKEALLKTFMVPVSIRNKFSSIDIGHWLAFRLSFPKSIKSSATLSIMQNALRDWNVLIRDNNQLQMRKATIADDPILWKCLDNHFIKTGESAMSSLQDLMTPRVMLSFSVRYHLEVCVSHGYLNEYTIDVEFLSRLASLPQPKAIQFLKAVDHRGKRFFRPMDIFEDMEFRKPMRTPKLPDHCIEIYHATVTATKIYFNTPSIEITNRVIRQYKQHADRFLRVHFEDDDYRGSTRLYSSVNNRMANLFTRVRRTMKQGIEVGDRHYQFLAWGNSQLREHGAYFFADLPGVISAVDIRNKMGEFSKEKIVAKCAARMGQCFSTTRSLTCRIPRVHESVCIPDIWTADGKHIFTDGVGKMSDMIAHLAGVQMGLKDGQIPSVIQFRLGGCKGVLAIDPAMQGTIDIQVRESQFKFASASNDLEIIRCSSFATADLNRQLILVLSELGVPAEVFLDKQAALIQELKNAMKSDDAAVKALLNRIDANLMTPVIAHMIDKGRFCTSKEPFMTAVLHLWRSWTLKYLKEKAKLPIPQSAFVLGCTDETQTLRGHFETLQPDNSISHEQQENTLPEIFLQITDPITQELRIIEGICVVARNPSLHLGDIRVVKAIDVPALHHLRDAVVFPQTGDRDLPSMCSGGDLDGDDFVVIWDQSLLPKTWNATPFHYSPPIPKQADETVTIDQIISFFVDYMENDFLGRIAHAHLGWADADGIGSRQCLELLQLHSLSVDYPKTGVPAPMEKRLEVDQWPHFMEKRGKNHHSSKILGKLYDAVEEAKFAPNYKMGFDLRILNAIETSEALKQHVRILKGAYDESMRQIMAQHHIQTEFEVWTTFVLNHSKKSNTYKFHEEIGNLSATMKEQYFDEIVSLMGGRDLEHLAPFAVAAYQVTAREVAEALASKDEDEGLGEGEEEPTEMPFISFPWILHDTLTKIAAGALGKSADTSERASTNDVGITFDEEGRPVFPILAGNLGASASRGDWLGHQHADPANSASALLQEEKPFVEIAETVSAETNGDIVSNGFNDPSAGAADELEARMRALQVEESDSD